MHVFTERKHMRESLTHWGRDKMAVFFQMTFSNVFYWIQIYEFFIKNLLKFVSKGPISNISTLVQIMPWRRQGDKPLSEQMMLWLPTHICVTRPQWVKPLNKPGCLWGKTNQNHWNQSYTLAVTVFCHMDSKFQHKILPPYTVIYHPYFSVNISEKYLKLMDYNNGLDLCIVCFCVKFKKIALSISFPGMHSVLTQLFGQ